MTREEAEVSILDLMDCRVKTKTILGVEGDVRCFNP